MTVRPLLEGASHWYTTVLVRALKLAWRKFCGWPHIGATVGVGVGVRVGVGVGVGGTGVGVGVGGTGVGVGVKVGR